MKFKFIEFLIFSFTLVGGEFFPVTEPMSNKNKSADRAQLLVISARFGGFAGIEGLLKNGLTINDSDQYGNTVLMELPRWGEQDVKQALDLGARPNIQNRYGWSALMSAASSANPKAVKLLLAAGADQSQKNKAGYNALSIAFFKSLHATEFQKEYKEVARLLTPRKADPKRFRELELMAKILAKAAEPEKAIVGFPPYPGIPEIKVAEKLSQLLEMNGNANTQDPQGNSALHYAASIGNIDAVRALLKAGANINIQNSQGITPREYAIQNNHSEIAQLLKGGPR